MTALNLFLLAVFFVATVGAVYSAYFKKHNFLSVLAVVVAIVSSYFFFESDYWNVVNRVQQDKSEDLVEDGNSDTLADEKDQVMEKISKEEVVEAGVFAKLADQDDQAKEIVGIEEVIFRMKSNPQSISQLVPSGILSLPIQKALPNNLESLFSLDDEIGELDESLVRPTKMRGIAYSSYIPYSSRLNNDFSEMMFTEEMRLFFRDSGNFIKKLGDPLNVVNSCCSGYTAFYHLDESGRRFIFLLGDLSRGGIILLAEVDDSFGVLGWHNLSALSQMLESKSERVMIGGALNVGNSMYFCLVNEDFSKNSKANSSFVVKLNLISNRISWISPAKTCASELTLSDGNLVTSYGGSYHLDYVYVIRTSDGIPIGRTKLPKAADYLIKVGDSIYGQRYYGVKFKLN